MPLKSRRAFPPGGFKFYEPRTGWEAMGGLDFDQVVAAIIKHRQANPRFANEWALDPTDVANELDLYTCARIGNNPDYCNGESPPDFRQASASFPTLRRRFQNAGNAVVGSVTKIATGIGLITEWLGSGAKPVAKELAEKRALVCSTCPHNKQSDLTSIFTIPASEMIRKTIAIKNDMKLETSQDSKLGVCELCACPLATKCWTPISHMASHISEKVKAELPDFCWQKQELSETK